MLGSKESKSMNDMNERFLKLDKLGEGTYGTVYKVKDLSNNKIVAVKKIKTDHDDEGIPATSLREISILKELNHINIVKLIEVLLSECGSNLYILFEFIEFDLKKFLEKYKSQIQPYLIKSIVYQILNGVHYMHSNRIFHRDLKPQNILITADALVKIADFGLARAISIPMNTMTHEIETLWYRAPEIMLGLNGYSLGVDIWSVGCIMAELITTKPLFCSDSEIGQLFKIFSKLGTPNNEHSNCFLKYPEFKITFPTFKIPDPKLAFPYLDSEQLSLFIELISLDPSKRISAKGAMKHKYFDSMDCSYFEALK